MNESTIVDKIKRQDIESGRGINFNIPQLEKSTFSNDPTGGE
jgi:hypothetical protein